VCAYNFGAKWSNLKKLFHVTCRDAGMIIWVQLFCGHPAKIWEDKKRLKFGAFSDNFRLPSRISPEQTETDVINYNVSHVKKLVNLCPLTTKLCCTHVDPPKIKCLEDYILAPRGCCPTKFLYVLENGQGLLIYSNRAPAYSNNFLQ